MIDLGQHWEFIAAAYGGALAIVAALTVWTIVSALRAKKRVAELDEARAARKAQ
jgi:hypothetical protein